MVVATARDTGVVRADLRFAATRVVATALNAILSLAYQSRSATVRVFETFDTLTVYLVANAVDAGSIWTTGRGAFVVDAGVTKTVIDAVIVARTLPTGATVWTTVGADWACR